MSKNILLALSGGYDSTYLLIKNLKEGNEVYPVYIHLSNIHKVKQIVEINMARNLINTLQKKFDKLHDLTEIVYRMKSIQNLVSMQPLIWALGLFQEVKSHLNNEFYDEAHIAYIIGDTAVSYQKELQALWKSLFSFSYPETDKYPKLVFPLLKYNKDLIINELNYYDNEIMSSCWTCENPHFINKKSSKRNEKIVYIEPCETCQTCTKLKIANPFRTPKRFKAIFKADKFSKDHYSIINKILRKPTFSIYLKITLALRKQTKKCQLRRNGI